jgi:hypothetical protein
MDKSKRQFLRRGLMNQVAGFVAGFQEGVSTVGRREEFERFFESDESCYALSLAYPEDILIQTAKRYGIETDGHDKKEIVKELFLREGGHEYRF